MGWLAILLCSQILTGEIEELVNASLQAQQESMKEILQEKTSNAPKKCSPTPIFAFDENSSPKLRVFISFSVPLKTWQDYSPQLVERGGVFVLRGLPDHSFHSLSQRIQELRERGVSAQIIIDPDLFDKHQVTAVPTIVLENAGKLDKMAGNITLASALRIFQEGGLDEQ